MDVELQPLGLVTVTVYVPGLVTVKLEDVLPPVHAYEPPPEATKVILVVVQVRTVLLAVILVIGAKKLSVIVILVVASQPFAPVTRIFIIKIVVNALSIFLALIKTESYVCQVSKILKSLDFLNIYS